MVVQWEGVSLQREAIPVLQEVSARLSQHRVGIVGANGSGKSSLIRLLNGLLIPDQGTVRVDGIDPVREPQRARRHVGFVFQNPDHQIVLPRVAEDLEFGLKNHGVGRAEREQRVAAMLSQMRLDALQDRLCHALSGGEKQMVALAGVLVLQPKLLVFDEPTTLLDLRNRNRFMALVAELPQPAIVVSHDLEWLATFERVLVLDGGRLVVDDEPGPALRWYREQMA